MASWRRYQEEVAVFFRSLGCRAAVEAVVQGSRSEHRIDVWVEFSRFGLEHRWVIECKKWTKPISKEKVLALRSLVDDVGADRGILVADSGFQPGAISAAATTNITLLTLTELYEKAEEDLQSAMLGILHQKAFSLERRLRLLGPMEETESIDQHGQRWSSYAYKLPPSVNYNQYIRMSGSLASFELALKEVILGQLPTHLSWGGDSEDPLFHLDDFGNIASSKSHSGELILVDDIREFVHIASWILENVDNWLSEQECTQG